MPTTNSTQDKLWANLSPQARAAALAHVKVYLDEFIGIFQGGQEEWNHMTRHLFRTIDSLFFPKDTTNKYRPDPIFVKKLKKDDASWSNTNTVLGWAIDTAKQVFTLPLARKGKLDKALDAIPQDANRSSKNKWKCLLSLLRRAVPTIAGAHGMFSRIQHALQLATSRRVCITAAVHDELNLWIHLVASLAECPTQLQ